MSTLDSQKIEPLSFYTLISNILTSIFTYTYHSILSQVSQQTALSSPQTPGRTLHIPPGTPEYPDGRLYQPALFDIARTNPCTVDTRNLSWWSIVSFT